MADIIIFSVGTNTRTVMWELALKWNNSEFFQFYILFHIAEGKLNIIRRCPIFDIILHYMW